MSHNSLANPRPPKRGSSNNGGSNVSQQFQPSQLVKNQSTVSTRRSGQSILVGPSQPAVQTLNHAISTLSIKAASSASGQSPVPQQQDSSSASGQPPVSQKRSPSQSQQTDLSPSDEEGEDDPETDGNSSTEPAFTPRKKRKSVGPLQEPDWAAMAAKFDDEGYTNMIEMALEYAVETGHASAKDLKREKNRGNLQYFDLAGNTLCMMPMKLVKELICGNVALAFENGCKARSDFWRDVEKLYEQGVNGKHAGIYLRTVADADGRAPFVWQVRELLMELRDYYKQARTADYRAYKIDHQNDPEWEKQWAFDGNRKYLGETTTTQSTRRANLETFCDALERLLVGLSNDNFFTPSFHYIGYALNILNRMEQHEKTGTNNTNWLGSLVLSILQWRWSNQDFQFHFHVMCLLGDEDQATIAEMLLAVIGHGYYWTGRGFNIQHCGASVASIEMKTISEAGRREIWTSWRKYIMEETPWKENLRWENELTKKLQVKLRRQPLEEVRQRVGRKRAEVEAFKTKYEEVVLNGGHIDQARRKAWDDKYKEVKKTEEEILKVWRR